MKVIFLDIDGVLNVCYTKGRDKYGQGFHPQFVENLAHVVKKTGARIVISSSWRASGLDFMRAIWKDRELPGEVIDITPFYNKDLMKHFNVQQYDDLVRGNEIQYWLDKCKEEIDSYVIFDDDDDMLDDQRNNFVCTFNNVDHTDYVDIGYGLTKECANQAIKILNLK